MITSATHSCTSRAITFSIRSKYTFKSAEACNPNQSAATLSSVLSQSEVDPLAGKPCITVLVVADPSTSSNCGCLRCSGKPRATSSRYAVWGWTC